MRRLCLALRYSDPASNAALVCLFNLGEFFFMYVLTQLLLTALILPFGFDFTSSAIKST
jgi:hypothetical protein